MEEDGPPIVGSGEIVLFHVIYEIVSYKKKNKTKKLF